MKDVYNRLFADYQREYNHYVSNSRKTADYFVFSTKWKTLINYVAWEKVMDYSI